VGFLTPEKVKKISLRGDSAIAVCDARTPVRASWTRDGVIYFSENAGTRLSRVDAQGGNSSPVAENVQLPPTRYTTFGEVLPGSSWVLLTVWDRSMSGDYARVAALSLDTLEPKILIRLGYDARYVDTGHLVFVRGGSLLAVAFDLERMETSGEPAAVVPGVSSESLFGQGQFAVSQSGTLAYVPGGDAAVGTLTWVDREGGMEPLALPEQIFGVPAISPDGRQLAIGVADLEDFVRIYDLETLEGRRFTTGGQPVWSPDGRALTYSFIDTSDRWNVARQPLDRSREPEVLFTAANWLIPHSWAPDEAVLGLTEMGARYRMGFLDYEEKPTYEAAEEPDTFFPAFSPDGLFVAYQSATTGRYEIWLRSADGRTKWQISTGEGLEPVWCKNGELFWRNGNRFLASTVTTQPELAWDTPRVVFETDFVDSQGKSYDVSPDGQRLLVVKERAERSVTKILLVENWFKELNRMVPVD
jgi:hypothetical protein